MASVVLSSKLYTNYLNDYVEILLKSSDRFLIEHLNGTYVDEIEVFIRSLLKHWLNDKIVDRTELLLIEKVGYLHRKLGFIRKFSRLNSLQIQRIDNLLFNSELIHLLTIILQSLVKTNQRHHEEFLQYFAIFLNAYSICKTTKIIFKQSSYYNQYLNELLSLSSNIDGKHLFFIGTIGQLVQSPDLDRKRNELYSKILQQFYNQTNPSTDFNIHYCTLGILAQIDCSYLITNYSCISTLVSMFLNKNLSLFIESILNIFNRLCIESKTIACYFNSDLLVEKLLQHVTTRTNACVLLGHIVSEQQLTTYRICYKLTMKLFDLLNNSDDERMSILYSLLTLVIHESVQNLIAETYRLKILIELSESYPICYEIIWKLSFHPKIANELITKHKDIVAKLSTLSPIENKTTKTKNNKISNWTNQDVQNWCETNQLASFSKILTSYDGKCLLALAKMTRLTAPHTMISQLRNDCRKQGLQLPFVDYVRFQTALNELIYLEKSLSKPLKVKFKDIN